MQKLAVLSILIAAIVIPVRNGRAKDAREGLRKTVRQTLIFNFIYTLILLFVWGRL